MRYINTDGQSTVVFPDNLPVFDSAQAVVDHHVRGGLVYPDVLARACDELGIDIPDKEL